MAGDGADPRAAIFEPNNRQVFDRPVDEAAWAWWLVRFFEPHGLTREGMGDLLMRSVAQEKLTRHDFIGGQANSTSTAKDAGRWPKPVSGASTMCDDRAGEGLYPSHNWEPLAADPFAALGPENSEIRSVLQRMWTRSGGDVALFDELLPLDGPYGRPPKSTGE